MVYTVIIAEQTVITVSANECIYQCDQELNKTGTLKPSVTNSFHLPNFSHMAWVNAAHMVFRHLPMVPQYSVVVIWAYGVVVSMFDFHRSDRVSNPSRGGKIS